MTPTELARHRLTDLRKKRGWSARELAETVTVHGGDISRSTIGKIEAGTRPIKLDELFILAVALGGSPLSLLMPEEDERFEAAPNIPLEPEILVQWFSHERPATTNVPPGAWRDSAPRPLLDSLDRWTADDMARRALDLALANAVERGDDQATLKAARAIAALTDLSDSPAERRAAIFERWMGLARRKATEEQGQ